MFVPFARQTIRQMGLSHTLHKLLIRWIASSELFRTFLSTFAATIILLMHVSGFSNLFCPFKVAIYGRLLKKIIQEKSRSREESHCKNRLPEKKNRGNSYFCSVFGDNAPPNGRSYAKLYLLISCLIVC